MNKAVAVVGFAFRLPGASDDKLWDLLRDGKDLVTQVEPSRWATENFYHPDKTEPGCSYTFAAGSVGDVQGFDADFFGISPREATQMDPQQRFLLDMTWEAYESGGIKPSSVRGSRTAVFVGYSGTDYPYRRADDMATIDASSMTGNTGSIAANRISYWYDLRGPSMAVDTACSSSLVAFHQAWQSIQTGEVDQAVVGGISLHLHPFPFVGFAKASMLSPRGVCSVFDSAGDGYVRSEGGGILLLKDLQQARDEGNRIFAVVAGSGVNCDGRTNGITVPGLQTQAELLRGVYERAGIDPAEVDYLEAHGTGTAVGDPIETGSIAEVLGKSRSAANPLLLGSVKSNLGHLETASGIAGLVKALYCLRHREVPPTIHCETVNPHIHLDEWNLRVVTENTPLPAEKPLVVGINSFGFGGANAHVVLRSDDARPQREGSQSPDARVPLVLSARSPAALRAVAARYLDHLRAHPEQDFYDLAYSAAFHREFLPHRAFVHNEDGQTIEAVLEAYAEGGDTAGVAEGQELPGASRPVFVYTGNGSQWVGMGQSLFEQSARFRDRVLEVDRLFQGFGGESIVDDLVNSPSEDRLALTEVAQPTLFAIQIGLTELLRESGVVPAAVVGHSVGEVAAAWACGALTLAQATRVIHDRSAQQGKTRFKGVMTAVGLSAEVAGEIMLEIGVERQVCVAGFNSPSGVTLAGSSDALDRLERVLVEREVFHRRLPLDYAFHSPAMDSIRANLLSALDDLKPGSSKLPFYSTVTGKAHRGERLDAAYWWRNIREPVRFEPAIKALVGRGFNVFVEIGPQALLRHYVSDCVRTGGAEGRIIATLSRGDDRLALVRETVYQLMIAGSIQSLSPLFPKVGGFVDLPRYAWQHEPFWLEPTVESNNAIYRRQEHPLLGMRLDNSGYNWEHRLDVRLQPELADHKVGDATVFPAAAFVEMALAAAKLWHPEIECALEDLEIRAPLLLEAELAKVVRCSLDERDGSLLIKSRERLSEDPWLHNVVGRILAEPALAPYEEQLRLPDRPFDRDAAGHYLLTSRVGLDYGDAFQTIEGTWCDTDSVIAALRCPDAITRNLHDYHLHPSLLDGCFQLLVDHLAEEIDVAAGMAFVPIKVLRLMVRKEGRAARYVRSRIVGRGPRSIVADFDLFDEECGLLVQVHGVRFRGVQLRRSLMDHTRYLRYRLSPMPLPDLHKSPWMPSREAIQEICSDHLESNRDHVDHDRYYGEVEPLLEVLCSAFAQQALRDLVAGEEAFDSSALVASGAIRAEQHFLVERLTAMLAEDGVLESSSEGLRWVEDATLPDPRDVWVSLLGDYPDYAAEFLMVGRAGMHLGEVLKGTRETAELVPEPCSSTVFSQYVGGSPTLRRTDIAVAKLAAQLIAQLPPEGRLRILQVGSCQSRLAAQVLARIDLQRSDYVLAAGRQEVLDAHEDVLERFPGVRVLTVDWSEPSGDRELGASGKFDLVLLGHALNELTDPQRTLVGLRGLMRSNAVMLVAENQTSRWMDLVFGLDPGWWTDDASHNAGFGVHAPDRVQQLVRASGFRAAGVLTEHAEGNAGPFLIVAGSAAVARPSLATSAPKVYCLIQEAEGYAAAIAEVVAVGLREAGHHVVSVVPGETFGNDTIAFRADLQAADQVETLVAAIRDQYERLDGFVWLQGLVPLDQTLDPATMLERQVGRCAAVSTMFQVCERLAVLPHSWLVTSGAAPAPVRAGEGGDSWHMALDDSPLWGYGRTLINEFPDAAVRMVDFAEPEQIERMAAGLLSEILVASDNEEVVLTGEGRFVSYVSPLGSGERRATDCHEDEQPAVVLDFQLPGPLKHLNWVERELPAPQAGEVEIKVLAAGLNFRDVMYAMGLLSDEAVEHGFAGPTLGMELSGVVSRLGEGVDQFAVGDEVIAFAPASFATRAVTSIDAVVRKPDDWSHESAATIPTTFFTAYYALHHLAHLQPGERILIHGAAGGVGIAAIQLAKHIGAEIFATAGSEEKRDFVRLLGADHVMDSRSLRFADEIAAATQGVGVDVVLNSLAGEAINRNLSVLRPFGRFLELGKRDFYENTRIGLRPFRNNLSYFGIDADQLMAERPALTKQVFGELMELFANGALKPLPYRAFAASDAVDAFRYMQQSKQIGKIVMTFDTPPVGTPSATAPEQVLHLSDQATYLVTGGLGGFGARTAQWLAEKGARHLLLLSRRGLDAPEAELTKARLTAMGVSVRAVSCDVTDLDALDRTLKSMRDVMPPLRGVVHAAMVIDDGLIRDLDAERIRKVFAPKILGALYLDELTRDDPLDFFVLYSSATTLFGNPGQASYVGANRLLEVLAERRRLAGRPALSISWGAIDDAGYLARNNEIKDALQTRMGGAALTAAEALDVLEQLLLTDRSGLGVLDFDWNALKRFLPSAESPRFAELARLADSTSSDVEDLEEVQRWVAELTTEELTALFTDLMKQEVGEILRLAPERIDENRSVYDIGMDSLMAMELVAAVEARFGVSLPLMALSEGPTLAKLVDRIVRQLKGGGPSQAEESDARREVGRVAAQHGQSGDDERLLSEVAAKVEGRAGDEAGSLID